jgi:5-bromo-4-chloroindolyl phosphate hydrolysis protein
MLSLLLAGTSWLLEPCPTPAPAPNLMEIGRYRLSWHRIDKDIDLPVGPGLLSEAQLLMLGMIIALVIERTVRLLMKATPGVVSSRVNPLLDEIAAVRAELSDLHIELSDARVREAQLAAQLSEANQRIADLEADLRLHETDKMARAAIHIMRKNVSRMGSSLRTWRDVVVEGKAMRAFEEQAAAKAREAEEKRLALQKRKALDDLATHYMLLSSSLAVSRPSRAQSHPKMI